MIHPRLCPRAIALAVLFGLNASLAAGGEPAVRGPLAARADAAGPHVAKLKALGDGEWINLGSPAPDPKWGKARGRSYTPKMAFALDLRGAFLYGQGVHGWWNRDTGRYMDDLWFYDIRGHRWICVHPGSHVEKLERELNADGFEVTKAGEPVPVAAMVHGYEMTTYNTDLRKFMFLPCPSGYWRKPLGARRSRWLDDDSDPYRPRSSPWLYNAASGKWERIKAEAPDMPVGFCGVLIYLPGKQQTLFYMRQQAKLWFFDHATDQWISREPQGPAPSTADYEGLTCLDSRRRRVYICNDKEAVVPRAYDVKTNRWLDLKPKNQPPRERAFRSANGLLHYDGAGDSVLFFQTRPKEGGRRGVYVYDVGANAWTTEPLPLPEGLGRVINGFYDPKLNIHFFHDAGDSRDNGVIWAFRYKRELEIED